MVTTGLFFLNMESGLNEYVNYGFVYYTDTHIGRVNVDGGGGICL
jgi:hypothetical protein